MDHHFVFASGGSDRHGAQPHGYEAEESSASNGGCRSAGKTCAKKKRGTASHPDRSMRDRDRARRPAAALLANSI